ncbi:MAG TPA: CCA tRNA nucleotidyltransferase [Thermoplasmata archaeon]|nr:CCA tRNA nucleotidyltransferase [Thermoplasmata archaeon]
MIPVEREVLSRIKPTAEEDRKLMKTVDGLVKEVRAVAAEVGAHIGTKLVGSVAKSTHMKGPDIDLFMMFPESTSLDDLTALGLEIGRRIVKGKEHYAQHPYVRGEYAGYQVDLVPCFMVKDPRKKMSAVDRTPFHTEFVITNLPGRSRDQVRLLKRFMKGIGCYGAEAKVQGFSGYLCELLVILYGDLGGVLSAASQWKNGEKLHLPNHPGNEFDEPLTFIDPVDCGRNVASAVSLDSLVTMIAAARAYMAEPGAQFFFPRAFRSWSADRLRAAAGERQDAFVAVSFEKLDLIDDVFYPQIRKSVASMVSLLKRNEFDVVKTTLDVDDRVDVLIELESMELPRERVHRGPPVGTPNAHEFLAKWDSAGLSKPYKERGRWFVVIEREHPRADALLAEKISSLTLGKDIKKLRSFEVSSGRKLVDDRRYARILTKHLDERMPWKR